MDGETSCVRGNERGCEASRVDHEYPRVGDEEGGHKTSGVGRVDSPQGADNPGVAKEPRGDESPGGPIVTKV